MVPTQTATSDESISEHAFSRRVLIASSLGIGLFCGLMLLWYAVQVLLIIFAGILVAVLLRGMANLLAKHSRLSQKWALAAIVVITVLLFTTVGYFVAPRVIAQVQQLYVTLPRAYGQLKDWAGKYPLGRLAIGSIPNSVNAPGGHGDLLGNVTGAASMTLSAVLTFVLIVFVGMYLAAEPQLYIDGLTRLFPKDYRDHVCRILQAVGHALGGWLVGQGIDMAFIGALTACGLWILGIPLAFSLGLLAALANFIPNFGPFIAFVPSALLALTINPHKIVSVGVLFLIVQGIEGYVLQPMIQRRTVSLPPALTVLAQVLLGLLLGPMGGHSRDADHGSGNGAGESAVRPRRPSRSGPRARCAADVKVDHCGAKCIHAGTYTK